MSETAQTARSVQGYRIELAPTPEQRVRLAQHAGPARVAENFCLEKSRRRSPSAPTLGAPRPEAPRGSPLPVLGRAHSDHVTFRVRLGLLSIRLRLIR
jgi:hypothetical protein